MFTSLLNPTGFGIRNDKNGYGHYGASRRKKDGGVIISYAHKGVDLLCIPGQWIVSPISGIVTRYAKPYVNDIYSGVFIQDQKTKCFVKMFYLQPEVRIGESVIMGQAIGIAQNISEKYIDTKTLAHIHVEIGPVQTDPWKIITMDINK